MMLPYRCIGLATFICIVTCVILLTFHQNQVQAFECFRMYFSCHYGHIKGSTGIAFTFSWTCRLYSLLSLCGRSVFFCYLAKVGYHIIKDSALRTSYGCDLTTNATLIHPSPLLKYKKNISLYKYGVSWVKKMLYLFSQQFFIYLQTATTTLLRNVVKLVASLLVATLLPITVHWTAGFTCC